MRFTGRRFDTGDKLGFLKATVEMALARPDLGDAFRKYLETGEMIERPPRPTRRRTCGRPLRTPSALLVGVGGVC